MQPILFEPVESPYLVPFDDSFRIGKADTEPKDSPGKKANEEALLETSAQLDDLQRRLYAHDHYSVLLVFQAMDAAGKDGTIRAVLRGVNPAGCQVYAFKAPSDEELDHDFLWRCNDRLPERGRIGVWNRSHYEEVIVVRVNPGFLDGQRLPRVPKKLGDLWDERYQSMRDTERHWARNGMVVLKFFLHVSKGEQRKRLLERIDDPDANWKFQAGDLEVRKHWDAYMEAYQDALNGTSRPWAPWYAIPADSKSFMRRAVSEIIVKTLEQLPLKYPAVSDAKREEMKKLRAGLDAE